MKSIIVKVPRKLVVGYYQHPEFYGESIVELRNGMITDVYTDDFGDLITITNDILLIRYLKRHNRNPLEF